MPPKKQELFNSSIKEKEKVNNSECKKKFSLGSFHSTHLVRRPLQNKIRYVARRIEALPQIKEKENEFIYYDFL